MRGYFARLKTHPGWGPATFFTLLGALAATQNPTFGPWAIVVATGICAVVFYGIVMLSNFGRNQ